MTIQESLTQFTLFIQDASDVSQPLFIQWANAINRYAYRLIADLDPDRYVLTTNYTTVSGTGAPSIQALPADFKQIQQWNMGFFLQDGNGNITNNRLSLTSPGQQMYGYFIQGTNVVFTNPGNATYTLRYIPDLAQMTSLADVYVIPDEYTDYILKALMVMYTQWDQDPNLESVADQRYMRVLDEMAANIRKAPMAFDMPDFSSNFNGFGGYAGGAGWWF